MKSYFFVRINQGTHQGWMPQFQNWNSIKKKSILLLKWAKKTQHFFFPFTFFDTNLLNFYSFFKVFWCCHLSFFLFLKKLALFYILFILKLSHCMLAKREKLKGKSVWKSKLKKKKCWGYPKHLFELLVTAIACVQRYIFYEKKAKTKKII